MNEQTFREQLDFAAQAMIDANSNKTVHIITDHDTDGIMSSIILYAGLKELGYEPQLDIIPEDQGHRLDQGWLNDIRVNPGDKVITADIGADCEQMLSDTFSEACVVVTDHHAKTYNNITQTKNLSEVNTSTVKGMGKEYCGATLAYQIIRDMGEKLNKDMSKEEQKEMFEPLRAFEMIAMVADRQDTDLTSDYNTNLLNEAAPMMADLIEGKDGIHMCNKDADLAYKRLGTLISDALVNNGQTDEDPFRKDSKDIQKTIQSSIAPLFNNIKHMGKGAEEMQALFTDANANADQLIDRLCEINEERKAWCKNWIAKHPGDAYVYRDDDLEYPGCRTLLASELSARYHHPVMIAGPKTINEHGRPVLYTTTVSPDKGQYALNDKEAEQLAKNLETVSKYGNTSGHVRTEGLYGSYAAIEKNLNACEQAMASASKKRPKQAVQKIDVNSMGHSTKHGTEIDKM